MVALLIITLGMSQAKVEQIICSTQASGTDMLYSRAETVLRIEA
jgi:hypothetical protein